MSHFNYYDSKIFFKNTPNSGDLIPKYELRNIGDCDLDSELNKLLQECKNKKEFIEIVETIKSRYADDFNIIITNKYSTKIYLKLSNDNYAHNLYFKYDKLEYKKEKNNINDINMQLSNYINSPYKKKFKLSKGTRRIIYALEILAGVIFSYKIYKEISGWKKDI